MDRYKIQNVGIVAPQNAQSESVIQEIKAYRETLPQRFIYYFFCCVTFGLLYLLTRWQIQIWALVRVRHCRIEEADYFLIRAADKTTTITHSIRQVMKIGDQQKLQTTFKFRFYKYYFDETQNAFVPLELNLSILQNKEIINKYSKGILQLEELQELRDLFGSNSTSIPRKSLLTVLVEEVLNPFYLFQIFSIILWYSEDYYQYATIILVTSLFSTGEGLYDYFSNFSRLQKLAQNESQVKVFRFCDGLTSIKDGRIEINPSSNKFSLMSSGELVPGDLLVIEDNQVMPCDLILMNGQCVMNEGMLTGESVPVMKNPLRYNQNLYNSSEDDRQSTLFAGTICIQAKIAGKGQIPVLALVTQIGFNTVKGQLIRSIMFTVQNSLKFYQDSMKFVAFFAMLAMLGFLFTLPARLQTMDKFGLSRRQLVIDALDLITITVPPALPTCLQIGISIALFRMKRRQIFCISPFKINIAGKITVMCFDKTGTLTEDGLDMYGVRVVKTKNQILQLSSLDKDFKDDIVVYEMNGQDLIQHTEPSSSLIYQVMASCHGLSLLQGKLIGDPLDLKMFETTKYNIQDEEEIGFEQIITDNQGGIIKVLRKFEFSSKLQRMSVIAQTQEGTRIYCKGSPEKLRELCLPQSIPPSFHQVLEFYAQNGFRVIACAVRISNPLEIQNIERQDVEQNLTFLGFIILQNKLKPITVSVISHLQSANIRTIMVTGDNILTAISVARSCNIIQKDQRVYFGELDSKGIQLSWKDFDRNQSTLNDDSLMPQQRLKQQEDEEVNDQLKFEGYQLSQIRSQAQMGSIDIKLDQISDDILPPSEYERVNDDEVEPWHNTTDDFVLAVSGAVFTYLLEQQQQNNSALFQTVLDRAQVYARMKPEEKGTLIKQLQCGIKRTPLVGFCGDGANDCAALKGADIGISLSPAEASIAAPFTSQLQDISCVPIVLCEGRAALTTSFTCFKFMVMYSIIQFTTVCILNFSLTNLTDGQFLYIDLFTILPVSMTMGFTHARASLNKYVPKGSLISVPVITSIVGQAIIQVTFQVVVYVVLLQQQWLVPTKDLYSNETDDYLVSYETTSIFLFANLQYLFTVVAFSTGKPFRMPFYTNKYFTLVIIIIFILDLSLILFFKHYQDSIYSYLGLLFKSDTTLMPQSWIIFLTLMAIFNSIITIIYERIAVPKISKYLNRQ